MDNVGGSFCQERGNVDSKWARMPRRDSRALETLLEVLRDCLGLTGNEKKLQPGRLRGGRGLSRPVAKLDFAA